MTPTTRDELVLSASSISKQFPGVRALDSVDLKLRPGEVHALMGENGAGKSTLIKAINGVLTPDGGTIELAGEVVAPRSVGQAERLGISTVFQEVNLIPMRSVAENLFLGRFPRQMGLIRWRMLNRMARAQLQQFGLDLDVTQPVSSYSIAMQQMVAIVRAVNAGGDEEGENRTTKVLILDEPTSSLDAAEIEQLFSVMRRLRDEGMAILFVTHFLDQVYAVSDRITVLRNGRLVNEWLTADLPKLKLVGAMTGREAEEAFQPPRSATTEVGREKDVNFAVDGLGKHRLLEPVRFAMAQGEVVGLAGLLGSGRTETAELCFGARTADEGHVTIDGRPHRFSSPRQAIRAGLGMTTEDRKVSGIAPNLSVRENMILGLQSQRGLARRIAPAKQRELAERYIRLLGIKTPSPGQPIKLLSGGNQQKVLLARWLITQPRLLILDEPTRGIDVGAKAEIARLIRSLADEGMSVLFISAELEEVAGICRHVVVLRDRQQVGELRGQEVEEHRIMQLIAGGEPSAQVEAGEADR